MIIIDARSGNEVRIGVPVTYPLDPDAGYKLLAVKEKLLSATALIQYRGQEPRWTTLLVRYVHPRWFLKKVAFVMS